MVDRLCMHSRNCIIHPMAIQEIRTITIEKKLRDKVIAAIGDKVNLISMRGDVAIVEHLKTKERFSVRKEFLS